MKDATMSLLATILCLSGTLHEAAMPWVIHPPREFVPTDQGRIAKEFIYTLDGDAREIALRKLSKDRAIELSFDEAVNFINKNSFLDRNKKHYIVRAVSDGRNGRYSVFYQGGSVVVIWTAFGGCYETSHDVLLLEIDDELTDVYAKCSGLD